MVNGIEGKNNIADPSQARPSSPEGWANRINNASHPQAPINLAVKNLKGDNKTLGQVYEGIENEETRQMFSAAVKDKLGEKAFQEFSKNINTSDPWYERTEGVNFAAGTVKGLYEVGEEGVKLVDMLRKAGGLINPFNENSVDEMTRAHKDLKNMGKGLIQAVRHPVETVKAMFSETKREYEEALNNGTLGYEMGKTYSGLLLSALGGGAVAKGTKLAKKAKVIKISKRTKKLKFSQKTTAKPKARPITWTETDKLLVKIAGDPKLEAHVMKCAKKVLEALDDDIRRLEKTGIKFGRTRPAFSLSINVNKKAKIVELISARFGHPSFQGKGLISKVNLEVHSYILENYKGFRFVADAINPKVGSLLSQGKVRSWLPTGGTREIQKMITSGKIGLKDLINKAKEAGSRGWTDDITNVRIVMEIP